MAGVRSIQPNSLIAWTRNSWSPSASGPTVTGDSQKKNGSPSREHWAIASGWSTQNSNVAEPLVLVGRPSGPSGPSGPEMMYASGAIPDDATATAKSEKPSTSLLHKRAGVENGLFSVVMSSHSLPSKWSSRTDGVGLPKSAGS